MILALLVAAFVIVTVVLFYFAAIKGADRYEPEPIWLLIVMFLWGAIGSTIVSCVVNTCGFEGLKAVMRPARGEEGLVMATGATIMAPLVEESAKGFGLLLLLLVSVYWLHEVNGPLDGAIYGGIVGLGFTMTEDIHYVYGFMSQKGIEAGFVLLFIRTILAGLGHASFTAMTGLGVGVAAETRNPLLRFLAPVGGWCAAVGLHAFHNLLASLGALCFKIVIFWFFDVLFFVLLFALAWRDRGIVLSGLQDEVGTLLDARELASATSGRMFLPLWNYFQLSAGGFSAYMDRRKKQLALVDLAFVKARRARGETGEALDRREAELRAAIGEANGRGVFAAPA